MLADHQGSIRQIIDNTGSLLNQITYDSYGNITHQTNPSVTFRLGYTGREWDGETGQYYYRARYYDARVGRFLSTDPIGFAAGDANLYRYVGNSPTNFVDPSGNNGLGWQVTLTGLGITQLDGPLLPFADVVGLPIAVLGGGLIIYEELRRDQENFDPNNFRRGTAPVTPPPSHTGHPRQTTGRERPQDLAPPNFEARRKNRADEFDDARDIPGLENFNDDDCQRVQKPPFQKGGTQRNNQAQNKSFNDAVRKINQELQRSGRKPLNAKQERQLHDQITKEGLEFHEIIDEGLNMFGL
jgi:RHS repeat-associated protein